MLFIAENTEPVSDTQGTATFLVGLGLVASWPRGHVLAKLHLVEVRQDILAARISRAVDRHMIRDGATRGDVCFGVLLCVG